MEIRFILEIMLLGPPNAIVLQILMTNGRRILFGLTMFPPLIFHWRIIVFISMQHRPMKRQARLDRCLLLPDHQLRILSITLHFSFEVFLPSLIKIALSRKEKNVHQFSEGERYHARFLSSLYMPPATLLKHQFRPHPCIHCSPTLSDCSTNELVCREARSSTDVLVEPILTLFRILDDWISQELFPYCFQVLFPRICRKRKAEQRNKLWTSTWRGLSAASTISSRAISWLTCHNVQI